MNVISEIYLSALLVFAAGASGYNNLTVGELPEEIVAELDHLRTHVTLDTKANCKRPQTVQVGYLLYTRNNRDVPTTLNKNNTNEIGCSKKVLLLIHGWLSNPNSSGIAQLKDAYLKRYDCNVILVDWSQMASKLYTTAYCHVLKVANYVAKFLCQTNLPLNEVHVVGHSMGGQIAGIVGHFVNTKCEQQIGRITGLDPSGPLFQNLPERRRLDKSDAQFVDVIHTDQMKFGFSGNCGKVDFHPNCGLLQPGCPSVSKMDNRTLLSDVFCSHHRSLDYMVESIKADDFVAVSCGMCPRYCRPNVINEVYAVMGEGCQSTLQPTNKFYLRTKSYPPYAEGWTLYDAKFS